MTKIIHISSAATSSEIFLFALADDGTIWRHEPESVQTGWTQLPSVSIDPDENLKQIQELLGKVWRAHCADRRDGGPPRLQPERLTEPI
jgi:hypothetical protein